MVRLQLSDLLAFIRQGPAQVGPLPDRLPAIKVRSHRDSLTELNKPGLLAVKMTSGQRNLMRGRMTEKDYSVGKFNATLLLPPNGISTG